MKAIFGLGNPGSQYKDNRHNAGYKVVDRLARDWGIKFKRSFKTGSFIAVKTDDGKEVALVKPRVFMNRSGACVKKFADVYGLKSGDILAVYDDVDLALGSVRFRDKGSCAGHRGMASIVSFLGTEEISRLRVGIGRPEAGEVSEYVLSDFSSQEEDALKEAIDKIISICEDWVNK